MESTPSEPWPRASASGRPRHTNAQRAILALNIFVVVACLIGAVALIYGKNELDDRLQTEKADVETSTADTADAGNTIATVPTETFPPADPQAQNFLITGSDSNPCVDPNSPWAGAADPTRDSLGSRSDTIMVMRVDPATRAAAVLSFPRDLWVKIPGKSNNRVNTAYVANDYSLLAQTLYDNFGIQVDHYVQVDFCAFKRIVEAVGGVAVPFDTRVIDRHVGLDVRPAAGQTYPFCHTFNGDEALAYVRSRHLTAIDANGNEEQDRASDLGRISRQQDFLRRTLQRALDKGVFDPKVARALLQSLQTDIVTESGFTIDDMLQFAGVLRDVAPNSIRTYQIESRGVIISGSSVLEMVDSENMRAILAVFRGTAPLATAPTQTVPSTTTVGSTTGTVGSTTGATDTTAVITGPDDYMVGDIVPSRDITC